MEELKSIMEKFVASGWDLISIPAQQWLDGKADKDILISAIKQAAHRNNAPKLSEMTVIIGVKMGKSDLKW